MKEKEFLSHINENTGLVWKLLHLYFHEEDAKKDMFQEVVLQCWAGRNNFRGDAKVSTWIYKVALFTILASQRKNTKRIRIGKRITGGFNLRWRMNRKQELHLLHYTDY